MTELTKWMMAEVKNISPNHAETSSEQTVTAAIERWKAFLTSYDMRLLDLERQLGLDKAVPVLVQNHLDETIIFAISRYIDFQGRLVDYRGSSWKVHPGKSLELHQGFATLSAQKVWYDFRTFEHNRFHSAVLIAEVDKRTSSDRIAIVIDKDSLRPERNVAGYVSGFNDTSSPVLLRIHYIDDELGKRRAVDAAYALEPKGDGRLLVDGDRILASKVYYTVETERTVSPAKAGFLFTSKYDATNGGGGFIQVKVDADRLADSRERVRRANLSDILGTVKSAVELGKALKELDDAFGGDKGAASPTPRNSGSPREETRPVETRCPACGGAGNRFGSCSGCSGKGKKANFLLNKYEDCLRCGGSGQHDETCPVCRGSGSVR